jgi:hypothetical protein
VFPTLQWIPSQKSRFQIEFDLITNAETQDLILICTCAENSAQNGHEENQFSNNHQTAAIFQKGFRNICLIIEPSQTPGQKWEQEDCEETEGAGAEESGLLQPSFNCK